MRFKDKSVLVTGAARGIGRYFAEAFAKDKLFRETFVSWYNFINQHGVSETIRKYLKKS